MFLEKIFAMEVELRAGLVAEEVVIQKGEKVKAKMKTIYAGGRSHRAFPFVMLVDWASWSQLFVEMSMPYHYYTCFHTIPYAVEYHMLNIRVDQLNISRFPVVFDAEDNNEY